MGFADRRDAGRRLAALLASTDVHDPVVLALARGGVPVGFEVARALGAQLEVFVARKIGAPGQSEYGIGAVAEGGWRVVDDAAVHVIGLSVAELDRLVDAAVAELDRRVREYRGDRPLPGLAGRDVIIVDDGLATGVTAQAALRAVTEHRPARVVVAAPVCAPETAERLRAGGHEVVCLITPPDFVAVGRWYDDFSQTTDDEVEAMLREMRRYRAASPKKFS